MRNSSKQDRSRSTTLSRKSVIGIAVAATVLLIGVVTALSMQSPPTQQAQVVERKAEVPRQGQRNYVTSNESGQTVVVDRQTGQWRPLTPEEASLLAQGIKQLVNQSTDGLVQIHHANGMVSMNLQGRFQDVLLAKKEADGTVSQTCVDNVDSAAAFFEIDPELLGTKAPVSKTLTSLKPEIR
ncbi:MAG TPA: hypothetical protein VGN90_18035 [Pyrinomonadaceae bacterium]|jgi:hypothetical protein|nr:hypothetical protein [Pyrinomonadaceae bacterium]